MVNLTTEEIGFNERLVSASFKVNANFEKFVSPLRKST